VVAAHIIQWHIQQADDVLLVVIWQIAATDDQPDMREALTDLRAVDQGSNHITDDQGFHTQTFSPGARRLGLLLFRSIVEKRMTVKQAFQPAKIEINEKNQPAIDFPGHLY
jgi:hypothetical protein